MKKDLEQTTPSLVQKLSFLLMILSSNPNDQNLPSTSLKAIEKFHAALFALSLYQLLFVFVTLAENRRRNIGIEAIFDLVDPDAMIDGDCCDLIERISNEPWQNQSAILGMIITHSDFANL